MENVMIRITEDNYVLKKLFPNKDIVSLNEVIYELETLYFEKASMIDKLPEYVIDGVEEEIDMYEDLRLRSDIKSCC